ncbi:MAG: putative Ig domain-containing protein [Acidobacteria bacterium]|nr:putative Ig domain-containing protein [Acidobacteriota bacterium]
MTRLAATPPLSVLLVFGAPWLAANPPPLSLPDLQDFRLPSASVFDTVFPTAGGGTGPYVYTLTGLPSGISFSASTRRAQGRLPAVGEETTYAATYGVTDRTGASKAVTFALTVMAPRSPPVPVRRRLETRVGLVYATEVDSLGQTYRFTLASRQTVSVSLTGMSQNFDCSVNGFFCSNRDGTRDDHWTGELEAGFHSIRVAPSGGESGDYTIMAVVYCPPGHFAHGGTCRRYVVPNRRAPAPPEGGGSTPAGDDTAPDAAPEVESPP